MRLRKGKNLKAVLDFWKMNEKRYEYPIKLSPNIIKMEIKSPANFVMKEACSPIANMTMKKITRGPKNSKRSKQ
jgi:hypothetical protein